MQRAILFLAAVASNAQTRMNAPSLLSVFHIGHDFSITELDHSSWKKAEPVTIGTYWSGEKVPKERRFSVVLLWSGMTLYIRFEAGQAEPVAASNEPNLTKKTIGLWERDVCEIFIAPDRNTPRRYFEFEVAPTGEWLDLDIDLTSGDRITDWDYNSGMEAAARIEDAKVTMAMKLPWKAFGRKPKLGDVWLGNIFRCVGAGESRGYLAWRPTMTERPNFHVPEAFGEFEFC